MRLILASASPRRWELLEQFGLKFEVLVSEVEETLTENIEPSSLAEKLAYFKACDVARQLDEGLVIGADTIVVLNGKVLGKPESVVEAKQMLTFLSGREHQVISGLALLEVNSGETAVLHEITKVRFRDLDQEEIDRYVASGEPMDKAGAYGIQGLGAVLIEKIEGCYFNVVGLPLARLYLMLKEKGIRVL